MPPSYIIHIYISKCCENDVPGEERIEDEEELWFYCTEFTMHSLQFTDSTAQESAHQSTQEQEQTETVEQPNTANSQTNTANQTTVKLQNMRKALSNS